jgi:PAS domain S-box-containing protein
MEHEYNKEAVLLSPWRLVFRLLIIIFLVEAVVMFVLITFFPEEHSLLISIADAAMLVILSAPFLWYFIVHPLRRVAIAEHLQAATIIEHSNDGIITSNEAGMVESFNPAAQRIFGFKAEEVLGKPMVQLMPERYRDAHQQKLRRAELAGKSSLLGKTIELHGLRRDGREFPLELSLSAWKTGRKAHYAGVIRDITERRQAEAEIQSRTVLLEQANRQQADFTAMIAHDLRSPLTNVIGIAEMMKDDLFGPVNEDQKKWLGKIGANVRNLVNLVSDFLDLSKLEAGHIELTKENVDLKELIDSNLESYGLLGRDKKITFRSSIVPDLPTVDADPRRLDQVLSNLLSNAVKFTPEGGQIEVGARTEDGRGVNFWVRDTGVGIPKEEIGNLFEKYKQASNTQNGSQNGTGLGLVICKMIVETHGGRIWIDSEEEKGTTVFVALPVAPGPQLRANPPLSECVKN